MCQLLYVSTYCGGPIVCMAYVCRMYCVKPIIIVHEYLSVNIQCTINYLYKTTCIQLGMYNYVYEVEQNPCMLCTGFNGVGT